MSSSSRSSSSSRLESKVAIVTASTAGIGLAIAERFLEDGAKVAISSRKQSHVDDTLSYLIEERGYDRSRVLGVVCHVGKESDVKALVEQTLTYFTTQKIDVVVSNAAVNPVAGPLVETPDDVIDKILDINVKAAIRLIRCVSPWLAPRASVVFISSYTAFTPSPPIGMYAVSKTALLGLTKAFAEELSDGKIRVNCVAPGIVPTKFADALVATEEMREYFRNKTMLKELGTPEKIAGVVAFLASDDSGYMTGETLVVSGGMIASRL
jgi:dehydrogenase/reductase SDR family member 4